MIPHDHRTDESAGKKSSRYSEPPVALRASVGSTDASDGRLARVGVIDRGESDLGAEETGPEVGVRTPIPHPATLRAGVPP
jgi:hypothetical protein